MFGKQLLVYIDKNFVEMVWQKYFKNLQSWLQC